MWREGCSCHRLCYLCSASHSGKTSLIFRLCALWVGECQRLLLLAISSASSCFEEQCVPRLFVCASRCMKVHRCAWRIRFPKRGSLCIEHASPRERIVVHGACIFQIEYTGLCVICIMQTLLGKCFLLPLCIIRTLPR